ncbi:nitroreductase family protein [Chloroflexota bacterium]
METADLASLIKSRRSIRSWQGKDVSTELLLNAIELATHAPNGGNQQNWRFYVIVNKDLINSIAGAVRTSAEYITSWPEASEFVEDATRIRERSGFFRSAPSIIAITTRRYQSPVDRILAARESTDARGAQIRQWRKEVNTTIQSAAAAIAYLLLILHQMGLGATWMTGPMQAKGEIENILKVPDDMNLVALIPVGYPDEDPPLKERKPVEEVCEIVK